MSNIIEFPTPTEERPPQFPEFEPRPGSTILGRDWTTFEHVAPCMVCLHEDDCDRLWPDYCDAAQEFADRRNAAKEDE